MIKIITDMSADFKEFYALANGFETDDHIFRIIPIAEIIDYQSELPPNEIYFAEYMIYSATWNIVIDPDSGSYDIVNRNGTGNLITITNSIFEFIEKYLESDGIFKPSENMPMEQDYTDEKALDLINTLKCMCTSGDFKRVEKGFKLERVE